MNGGGIADHYHPNIALAVEQNANLALDLEGIFGQGTGEFGRDDGAPAAPTACEALEFSK